MTLFRKLARIIDRSSKQRVLHYLKSLSDEQLAAYGYSSTLLAQGIKGWPWREDNELSEIAKIEGMLVEEQRFVNELQTFTDAELRDLGVARSGIKSAVRHGRPGIDKHSTERAA